MTQRFKSSWHRAAAQVTLSALAVGILGGCGTGAANVDGPHLGHALREAGYSNMGTLTIESAARGHVYGFALDLLYNTSKEPITFESARVDHIPTGTRFVEMGLYSNKETDGTILGGSDSNWDGSAKGGTDYGEFPNHYGKHLVIPPKKEPVYYPVVFVRFEAHNSKIITMKDCTIFYKQGGKQYQQHQYCEFKITAAKE